MLKQLFYSLIVISCSQGAMAQFGFEYDPSIPVIRNGVPLIMPWAGGLNYTQVSDFDYDFDGDMDLLLFDRSNNNLRVLTQENSGGQPYYQLAYNAVNNFPADIRYRGMMVDYDGDGRKDLWTYGISGIKVYRNVGDATNGLQWILASDLVYTQYTNGSSQLYVSSSDVPAIIDVDGDGDIDVLTFHQGGEHVEYHQNQSMELYGIPDSLIYELKNECWGKFKEDFNTNVIELNDPNSPCVGGNIPNPLRTGESNNIISEKKHSGSTLLALDLDNSGVLDLIIGDVSYPTMTKLLNGGTAPNTNSAMISQDNFYPSSTTPINLQLFPAAYYVDVDFDGIKDLIATPSARNVSENESSVRFYKNLGTNSNPNFIFSSPNYFQKEMIEHGTGSIPVLFDVNEDGLKDLLVANVFRYIPTLDKESTIAYYRNTGTASAPQYTYIDYNYLDLDQQNFGLRSVPTFGDLDADGDEDLILGIEDGTLVYYQNNSTGSGAVFGAPQINFTDNLGTIIDVDGLAHPQLFDLDNDNLLDLIVGTRNGRIAYYRNVGTATTPSFSLENSALGSIDLTNGNPNVFITPHFMRINDTTHLFAGSVEGKLYYFDSIDSHLAPGDTFHLVSPHYLGINVESYSSFFVDDIDNDGNLNMYVGQDLGGLYHFEADPNSSVSLTELKELQVALYPNPGTTSFTVTASQETLERVILMDMNGREIQNFQPKSASVQIETETLARGTYMVYIETATSRTVRKWVKL